MDRVRLSNLPSCSTIERHSHAHPYAAVVVRGRYEEAGECGRHRVVAGDVLMHAPFSAHCDRVPVGTHSVLDIPLPAHTLRWTPLGRVRDVDAIVNAAMKDPAAAVDALFEQLSFIQPTTLDLPDLFAAALAQDDPPRIAEWAREHGIARETLSRQFHSLYGVAPAHYRVEARARRAWRMIQTHPRHSLADIAAAAGFADQAHLTRDVARVTGHTPGYWQAPSLRPSHSFKTGTSA